MYIQPHHDRDIAEKMNVIMSSNEVFMTIVRHAYRAYDFSFKPGSVFFNTLYIVYLNLEDDIRAAQREQRTKTMDSVHRATAELYYEIREALEQG